MKEINKKTQHDELKDLQAEYLKSGDLEIYKKMWTIALQVCSNIIYGVYKKKNIRINDVVKEEIEEKSIIACEYVMRRFHPDYINKLSPVTRMNFLQKYPDGKYRVTKNFITTLNYGCKHALDYCNREQKNFDRAYRFETYKDNENKFSNDDVLIKY